MAKIIIHKGFISYGGRFYKAGEVVPIADNNYAKRMVARSGGDFDFYHSEDIPAADGEEAPTMGENMNPANDGEEEDGAGDVSESDNGTDGTGGELPAIEADADVQTAKPTKGKKR